MKYNVKAFLALLLSLLLCIGCSPADSGNSNIETTAQATEAPPTVETTAKQKPEPTAAMLNGVELSEYTIIYSDEDLDYSLRAAEYIQSQALVRTQIQLSLCEDDEGPFDYEIVVGETSREISQNLDADTQGVQFAILADGGQIALEGDYFVIAAAAYFFVETYIPKQFFDSEVPAQVSIYEPIVEKAENYIFLIGDGMGEYQTRLFEIYDATQGNAAKISDGEDSFYGYLLPYMSYARTDSLSGTTDSAASGTALATGYKTKNGRIGRDQNGKDLRSLTELAGSLGKATAVMSTEGINGATPSAFSAHANNRSDEGVIETSQKTLQDTYNTILRGGIGMTNYTPQAVDGVKGIINLVLGQLEAKGDNGFFLMYEEAHIDKNCHSNDMDNTFLAVVRFNQAIAQFMEYAFYHPNTFVLITADHETGSLLPDGKGGFAYGQTSHSSADVRVFSWGDGGELFHGKTIENVQIPKTIASFWGVSDFGDTSSPYPVLK